MRGQMFLCVMLLGGILAVPAHAQVNVNVNIGGPPPVVVRAAPTMVFLPDPGVYAAVGVPYDIYFINGRYYYFNDDEWFWAPGYGGPWVFVSYRTLPPGLRKFKMVKLHEFREREYRVYKVQGRNFKGEHFEAESVREHGNNGHHKKGKKD